MTMRYLTKAEQAKTTGRNSPHSQLKVDGQLLWLRQDYPQFSQYLGSRDFSKAANGAAQWLMLAYHYQGAAKSPQPAVSNSQLAQLVSSCSRWQRQILKPPMTPDAALVAMLLSQTITTHLTVSNGQLVCSTTDLDLAALQHHWLMPDTAQQDEAAQP